MATPALTPKSMTALPIELLPTAPEPKPNTSPQVLQPLTLESHPPLAPPEEYPEGGLHAWLTILGSFTILTSTFGFLTSIGTLQAYWETLLLSNYTSSTIGWIPSVLVFLCLILGVQIGPLFDRYGSTQILLINSIIYVASFFIAAQCTRYWEFMLSIGILGGASSAGLTTVAMAAPTHWFWRRRGLAIGTAMVGSSLGGVSFPFILNRTFDVYGWAWSMRIMGFIIGFLSVIGNWCIRTRLPKGKQSGSISMNCFKDARFVWATIGISAFEFTLFSTLALLPTYALALTFPTTTSFALLSLLNGCSGLGRFLSSTISDHVGHFNTMICLITWTLLTTLALWFPIGHVGSKQGNGGGNEILLYVFAGMFGFGSGSVISLAPLCVGGICGRAEFGEWFGTSYFVVSFATLICIPASGEILSSAGTSAFIGCQAAVLSLSLLSFCIARWACLKYRWRWVVKV